MGKKSSMLPLLRCDLCLVFSTKNAYIYRRHKIRCKREKYTETHTPRPEKLKIKLSGASLFASASTSKLENKQQAEKVPSSPMDESVEMPEESAECDEEEELSETSKTLSDTFRKGNLYSRTYRCPECDFCTNKSKNFLYHQVNHHKRNLSIFSCNFCEYACKHRHKVQRHLKLVHRFSVDIDEVMVEYQTEKSAADHKMKSNKNKVAVESPVKNISPLKVKIALTTPASRQAARGKEVLPAGYENHMVELKSGGKKLFKCKYCLFNNGDKYRVSKHVQSIHINAKSYKCSVCSFTTVKKKDYYAHKTTHNDKSELHQCSECDYTSDFKPNLDRHRLNHINRYEIKCKFCSYSCDHEGTVKRHMANNHKNSAENVSLIFPDADTAVESTIDDTLPQPQVLKNVTTKTGKGKQKEKDSPDLAINISDRNIGTDRIPSLQTVEGSFFCPLCGLKYKRSSDLNRHMKLKHKMTVKEYLRDLNLYSDVSAVAADFDDDDDEEQEEEKESPLDLSVPTKDTSDGQDNLKCCYCSYNAKWRSDLQRHMAVHTVEKRYKCPHCNKQYKYIGDLNVHLRRDHKKEPGTEKHMKVPTIPNRKSSPAIFKCPSCSFTSPWKSEIDRHSKLHKGDKPFSCKYCMYQTHWKGDIRRHMYKHHPAVMVDDVVLDNVINILVDKLPVKDGVELEDEEEEQMEMESNSSHDTDQVVGSEDVPNEASDPENTELKDSPSGLFKCNYCDFITNAPSKLKAHESTHTNLKEYMCPECGRRANWKWDIRKHIKKDHPKSRLDVVKLSRQEAEATIQTYLDTMPVVRREHHLNVPSNVPSTNGEAAASGNSFVCSACDFNSSSRVAVSRHIRNSHNGLSVDIICLVEEDVDEEVQIKIPRASSSSVHAPRTSTPVLTSTPESTNTPVSTGTPVSTSTPVSTGTPMSTSTPMSESPQSFTGTEQVDKEKPYMCAECGKTGNIKADIRKHYHYRHPNQPIRIWYSDETGTKMLPVDPPMSRNNSKRKLSSSSSTSSLADPQKLVNGEETSQATRDQAPEEVTPQKKASPAVLIKPFMCAECGKRGTTKADIKKHYNYIHPGSEVKVVYQESSNSPYDRYAAVSSTQTTPASSPMKASPAKFPSPVSSGGAPLTSADPKVFGYCKPFQCSECGRRSNWKWDLNKHIKMKHPSGTNAHMITLSEADARASHDDYMANFNQTTHISSAYKKAVIQEAEQAVTQSLQGVPSKGVYKQFKCSGCPYRSNWRSDIMRHTKRKHGGRSRLVVMDTEEAKQSLMEYDYNPRKKRDGEMLPKRKLASGHGLSNIWKCGRCTFKNRDRTIVINHLSMHNIKAYKCSVCNYATNYRSSAYRHIRVRHHSENLSLCRSAIKCVKEGKDGQIIEPVEEPEKEDFDWKEAEPDNFYDMFKCKLCGFQSSWRSCVTRHLREKHKGGGGKGRVLKVRKFLKDEKKSNGELRIANRRYKCDICPYRTDKANLLQFHVSCHKPQLDVEQVKCPYCPYFVVAQRLLRQHMKLHERNVYKDTEDKEVVFVPPSTPSTPTTPVKNPSVPSSGSSTPKRHRCEKCPYTSNSKNDYLYHKQFHKPKENAEFKCHLCDYWVTHKRLLKQHMKVHDIYYSSPAGKSTNSSVQSSPCKSDFSESSSIYDMVQLANYKQKVIASKIMPSISQKPLMSPMKIACSVGNKPGYVFRNGVYKKLQKCKKCPYMNVRLRNLKLHEMMHGGRISRNALLKCPHCDYYVGSKGLLSHHLKVHQPGYMTDITDTTIAELEAMEGGGLEDEVDDKSDIVEIPYESKVDTLYEIARFKKYSCEKCPYASAKRTHYEHHVELHGSKQRCGCRYCDYSVPSQNLLAQHEKLHRTPNQNLMVAQSLSNLLQLPEVPADVALASALPPLDTKESFTVSVTHDHLELFENSAEADTEPKKLYRCDRCPYANVRRDHLLSHLKFHMIRGDLACPYCDYTASKQHLLTQHIKVHFSPLPELSNWLAQNGQMDRVKESKEPDITEALHIAQLLQGECKKEEKRETTTTGDARTDETGQNADKFVTTGNKSSSAAMEIDEAVPSSSSDCKLSTIKPVVPPVENGTNIEEGTTLDGQTTVMGVPIKQEVMDDEPVADGDGKTNGYICQYCDRELPASDQLLMHEMQHLIGNNFKDYLVDSPSNCQMAERNGGICMETGEEANTDRTEGEKGEEPKPEGEEPKLKKVEPKFKRVQPKLKGVEPKLKRVESKRKKEEPALNGAGLTLSGKSPGLGEKTCDKEGDVQQTDLNIEEEPMDMTT